MMKTKDIKKGISLIVLIITIIVVIILVAVVILTLSKNNPIESAKEARFKEDVRTFQDELALTVSKQYTTAGGHRDTKITTSDFNEIQGYIPSFSEKYKDKFAIQDDELKDTNKVEDNEKEWLDKINVSKYALLPKEYQQVQYVESTGTQYIDTNQTLPFSINIQAKLTSTNKLETLIGCQNSGFPWGASYIRTGDAGNFNFLSGKAIKFNSDDNIHRYVANFYKDNARINIDDESYGNVTIDNEYLPYTVYFFAMNSGGQPISFSNNFQIYECKMYSNFEGEILIKNFIPCYATTTVTNVDGEICEKGTAGLYDLVEGKFYTNKGDKTKGDFVCGPEV